MKIQFFKDFSSSDKLQIFFYTAFPNILVFLRCSRPWSSVNPTDFQWDLIRVLCTLQVNNIHFGFLKAPLHQEHFELLPFQKTEELPRLIFCWVFFHNLYKSFFLNDSFHHDEIPHHCVSLWEPSFFGCTLLPSLPKLKQRLCLQRALVSSHLTNGNTSRMQNLSIGHPWYTSVFLEAVSSAEVEVFLVCSLAVHSRAGFQSLSSLRL